MAAGGRMGGNTIAGRGIPRARPSGIDREGNRHLAPTKK